MGVRARNGWWKWMFPGALVALGTVLASTAAAQTIPRTPTGSTPTGSTPTGSTPTGSTPTGSTPTGSTRRAAPTPSDFRLRATLGGGFVASADQRSFFLLDLPVAEAEVRAGWVVHELVVLEARLGGGAFFSSREPPGGLLDLTVGLEVGSIGVARAYGSAHLGAGLTGDLVRPVLRLAVGVDVEVDPQVTIGPMVTYGHVFQEDGEGFSDDAQFVTVGISLTHRPMLGEGLGEAAPEPPAREPPAREPPAREPRPAPRPALLPPTPPPPVELESPERLMELLDDAAGLEPRELLVPVLFRFDSTELIACSIGSLHSLRDHLEEHPEIEVLEIEGHADGAGSDDYNRELSLQRAERIRDWLVEHGVAEERLRVRARGEATPVESNDDESGREQNRRARFRVVQER